MFRSPLDNEIVNLPAEAKHARPWRYFDEEYYVGQCVARGINAPITDWEGLLQHYLKKGARFGLSPNPFFDEGFYLSAYPDVVAGIASGDWNSGFDHFQQVGIEVDRSPTWFFSPFFYRSRNKDLSNESLRFSGFSDIYSHYLLVGLGENRTANWLAEAVDAFGGKRAIFNGQSDLKAAIIGGFQELTHYAPAFDVNWISEKYSLSRAFRPIDVTSFYFARVKDERICPSAFFDEHYYLENNPEIAGAVQGNTFSSGFEHFVLHGCNERRRPFSAFDPTFYFDSMAKDSQDTSSRNVPPFSHYMRTGRRLRRPIAQPLADQEISEEQGKGIYERRAALAAKSLSRAMFYAADQADVTVVVVARDKYKETANCIVTLASSTLMKIHLILYDNGSVDNITEIPNINSSIVYIRSPTNLGFTLAVNNSLQGKVCRYIILLNNDVEVGFGAVDYALETLEESRDIGAVGGKIIRMHGRAQEAGSIIWRDGTCLGYGRDGNPNAGEINFALPVDFCSGCFLVFRTSDWVALNGFDETYAPAYYEETDFCVRLWQAGKKVIYDPRVLIWHFEFGSSTIAEEALVLMRRNQRYFARKHRAFLENCIDPGEGRIEAARFRHLERPRVLFLEDKIPVAKTGMGFVRSSSLIAALSDEVAHLSVCGLHEQIGSEAPLSITGDRLKVEYLTSYNISNTDQLFRKRVGVYDFLWISRTHNLRYLREWRSKCPEFFEGTRVILDTEAVVSARQRLFAEICGRDENIDLLLLREFEGLEAVERIIVVNALDEALVLRAQELLGVSRAISILGHSLVPLPVSASANGNKKITLVGSFGDFEAPNSDSVLWFDAHVRSRLDSIRPMNYTIAGNRAADFASHFNLTERYEIIDSPKDMTAVYEQAAVIVACTRFAGGIPFKVHEAAGRGVPVAMSDVLSRQLGWSEIADIATCDLDPARFSSTIYGLLHDRGAWERCRMKQIELVEKDCAPEVFKSQLSSVFANR